MANKNRQITVTFQAKNRAISRKLATEFIESFLDIAKIANCLLDIIVCDDKTIKKINRQYLKKNSTTDVIAFGYECSQQALDGEIYINIQEVKRNAQTLKRSIRDEFLFCLAHGLLHLCGFKDYSDSDRENMFSCQQALLDIFRNER